jgi:5'-nucleotidase
MDFKELSFIEMSFTNKELSIDKIEQIIIDSTIAEKPEIKAIVDSYVAKIEAQMGIVLGEINVDLEGRHSFMRTQETNLGNFVSDIMLSTINADCALLNSGTFRSNMVHPAGEFKVRDLKKILPYLDGSFLLSVTGEVYFTFCDSLFIYLITFL